MDKELKAKFLNLACAMSPENLHCDGEISRAAARRKLSFLKASWKSLEKKIGRKVFEEEVWA